MQSLSKATPSPRIAFLGFCERAEVITQGHVAFWKHNLLGLSSSLVFYLFPSNLRGMTIALAIYEPIAGENFKLIFRDTQRKSSFDIAIQIAGATRSDAQPDSTIAETTITTGVVVPGWAFIPHKIDSDLVANSPGIYEVFLVTVESEELYLGQLVMSHAPVPPFTAEDITALKSDPLAAKFVRMDLKCNLCQDGLKAYAGIERSSSSEAQGFQWNLDIKEDEFVCSCGKARISLIPIKTGLHGLLRRNLNPQTQTNVSSVRLYESTALEQYCRRLLKLLESGASEEAVQKFLEAHPIFFHLFLPNKIVFKPPILTKYFADFAVLNRKDELLLIEIERPSLKMLKKDGGRTAGLEHAFHQVRTWKQVLDDHRGAALDAIGLRLDEVAKVRGVVIAGRKPSDERMLRMLRALSSDDIELFTYDDLLATVTELIKHVAAV
jgi:Domain of unknown function (DUF4263)